MKGRAAQIGLLHRIRLEWLEKTANLILAGSDRPAIEKALREVLWDRLSVGSTSRRCAREKTITNLMKIWVSATPELQSLRQTGLELIKRKPHRQHIAIHWGMISAVYPFWGTVAASVGRLSRLQGTVALAHVQRRLKEHYGEREIVMRASQRVLRNFIDWEVLEDTEEKGVYRPAPPRPVSDALIVAWLFEAALHLRENGSSPLKALRDDLALFPFAIDAVSSNVIEKSHGLEVVRHGLDDELVMLRRKNQVSRKEYGG